MNQNGAGLGTSHPRHLAQQHLKRESSKKKNRFRDRVVNFFMGIVDCIFARVERWFPDAVKHDRIEDGFRTKTRKWREMIRVVMRVMFWSWFGWFVWAIFIGVLLFMVSGHHWVHAEAYRRVQEAERMLSPIGSTDRMHELLKMKAKPFPFRTQTAKDVLRRMNEHHNRNPAHVCLTAKHVGDEYAAITLKRANSHELFVILDPTDYDDVGYEYAIVDEESDFFPRFPPIKVKRALKGRISYANTDGVRQRDMFDREELICIAVAMEILNGKHYQRWTSRNSHQ